MFQFFKNSKTQTKNNQEILLEQAVIVDFAYEGGDLSPVYALEDELDAAINKAGVGVFDGNEFTPDGTQGTFFMYGPNADALFEVVQPILKETKILKAIRVKLRYGPAEPGAQEKRIDL